MNTSYVILNRKPSLIIKIFIFNIIILVSLIIWGINTLYYQTYLTFLSKVVNYNDKYVLEILTPISKVTQIKNQNKIIIDKNIYNYQIYEIDNNIVFINNTNHQKIYLEIPNLSTNYLINGYKMDVKFPGKKQKIINYLKNEKEE